MRAALLAVLCSWSAAAEPVAMGIADYVDAALARSLPSRSARLRRDVGVFEKDIVFRGTIGPVVTASASARKDGFLSNNYFTKSETRRAGLAVSQPLLSGGTVDLTGSYSGHYYRDPAVARNYRLGPGWGASVSQPVFLFKGNPALRSRRRAVLEYERSAEGYRADVLNVTSEARALYYDVLLKQESLAVEARKLEASKALLDVTKELVDAGKLPGVETLRSRVRVERDRRQHDSAVNELRKSQESAKSYIGASGAGTIVFTSTLTYRPFLPTLESLTKQALEGRPELARLMRSVELSGIDLAVSKEETKPAVTLTGAYNYYDTFNPFAVPLPATMLTRDWNAGAAMSWRFYDFSVTKQKARAAAAAVEQARVDYDQAVRETSLSVMKAYMDVKTAESQLVDFQGVLESARNNIGVLRIQFQNGRGKLIDVFDAENEARSADLEYLNLLVDYYVLQDSLAELVGGLRP